MNLKEVKLYKWNTRNPEVENAFKKELKDAQPADISLQRDRAEGMVTQMDVDKDIVDFYTTYDPFKVTMLDVKDYEEYVKRLTEDEKKMINSDRYYYQVTVENVGGLIMPLIFEFEFADGTTRRFKIPAEIWKMSEPTVTKVFALDREATNIALDPQLETADVELNNNFWPARIIPTKFELFKQGQQRPEENPMQKAKRN